MHGFWKTLLFSVLIVAPSFTHGMSAGGAEWSRRMGRAQAPEFPGQEQGDSSMQQFMVMNPDGQYSFAYTGPESSRHERRHLDGTVEGKYSYRNPEGKLVQVKYQADARGFNTLPNSVIEDTPAVKDAREKFFEVYARELARIQGAQVQADQPSPGVVVTSEDTEVVHAPPAAEVKIAPAPVAAPTQVVKSTKAPGPAYFYYVGVGDNNVLPKPYYVISPVRESTNIAVSVRASQLGAIPADAVHDAQVPQYGKRHGIQNSQAYTRPVYIELGGDYQLPSGVPVFQNKLATSPAVLQFQRPYYFVQ